ETSPPAAAFDSGLALSRSPLSGGHPGQRAPVSLLGSSEAVAQNCRCGAAHLKKDSRQRARTLILWAASSVEVIRISELSSTMPVMICGVSNSTNSDDGFHPGSHAQHLLVWSAQRHPRDPVCDSL